MYCEQSTKMAIERLVSMREYLIRNDIILGRFICPPRSATVSLRVASSKRDANFLLFNSIVSKLFAHFPESTSVSMVRGKETGYLDFEVFSGSLTSTASLHGDVDAHLLDVKGWNWEEDSGKQLVDDVSFGHLVAKFLKSSDECQMDEQDHINGLLRFAAGHASQCMRRYGRIVGGGFACCLDGRVLFSQPLPLYSIDNLSIDSVADDLRYVSSVGPNPIVATVESTTENLRKAIVRIQLPSHTLDFESEFEIRHGHTFWKRWKSGNDHNRLGDSDYFMLEKDFPTNLYANT